jgi:signal transduction histidine kinase
MEYLIGVLLALAISIGASLIGLDRDKAFYPTCLIVIGFLYALFAIMGGSMHALWIELIPGAFFLLAAVVGFKRNLWIVATGLVAHGLFDFVHGHVISNPGVPTWWPMFGFAYDVTAGVYLAWLLKSSRRIPL